MIKGAIFDLDGTLLNSMFVWATIGERYLRSIGYEPRENLNETFRAMSLYQAACYYRKAYGVTRSVDEIMTGVNKMVEKYYREELILKAGAEDLLHGLRSRGISMCIATATDKYLVEAALKRCEVRGFFSEINNMIIAKIFAEEHHWDFEVNSFYWNCRYKKGLRDYFYIELQEYNNISF